MKSALLVLLLAVVAIAHRPDLDEHWKIFKQRYNKQYNGVDEAHRRYLFEKNVDHIESHNRMHDMGFKNYRLGINQFADMSNMEFRNYYNGYKKLLTKPSDVFTNTVDVKALPDTVDWRDKKVVTDVKNQAQCGSCWAFSTTGSVEGAHALATNKLVSLSEQNLVDCSGPEGNMGCGGGLMDYAFEYIIKNGGIDTEESYPYEGVDGTCRFNKANIGATISSYKDVASGDEKALQQAVAQVGPISVAIDASNMSFQFYSGGIYDEEGCSSSMLDHGVLAVGYGTDNGVDYWLVKNSWDTTWGSSGYIKMSRNKNNQCGIATQASYPIV